MLTWACWEQGGWFLPLLTLVKCLQSPFRGHKNLKIVEVEMKIQSTLTNKLFQNQQQWKSIYYDLYLCTDTSGLNNGITQEILVPHHGQLTNQRAWVDLVYVGFLVRHRVLICQQFRGLQNNGLCTEITSHLVNSYFIILRFSFHNMLGDWNKH